MQNLPQVNTPASSKTEHTGNNSTANAYDRLHPSKDQSIEQRFAAILSNLKQRLGSGSEYQRQESFATSLRESNEQAFKNSEQAEALQEEKEEKAERARQLHEQRLELASLRREKSAQLSEQAQALDRSSYEQQMYMASESVESAKQQTQVQKEQQDDKEQKALRPSDILAAAMAAVAQSGSSSTAATASSASSSTSTSASGAAAGSLSSGSASSQGAGVAGSSAFASLTETGSSGALTSGSGLSGAGVSDAIASKATTVSGAAVAGSGASAVGVSGSTAATDAGATLASVDGATADNASGNGFGSGSNAGNFNAVGLGNDDASPSAQAAAKMLQLDGVESDKNLAQSLNQLNRQPVMQQQPHSPSASEQLAAMDGKELKKSLDALARENNVSKLSLKMANPQALAAMRRDAQMLSQLPSSPDTLASLTGTGEVTRLHLMANASNGTFSVGSMTGSEASIEQVAAMGMRQMGVTGRTSTEILMQQNRLRQESHGLVEQTAYTAAARAEQARQQLESQFLNTQQISSALNHKAESNSALSTSSALPVHSAAVPTSSASTAAAASTLGAVNVPNTLAPEVAAKSAAFAALGAGAESNTNVKSSGLFGAEAGGALGGSGSGSGSAAAASAAVEASGADSRAALLRLAQAQDEITSQAMLGDAASGSAALSDAVDALSPSSDADSAVESNPLLAHALQSLQQGVRPENTGSSYEHSVFASMLTANALTEDDLARAARESEQGLSALQEAGEAAMGTGAHFDANSASAAVGSNNAEVSAALMQDEAQAKALVQEQLQAQAQAREELEREFTNMNFSADPTSDAAMLHERVMRMAARNLKHLAVDLNPRDLGKMRIAIELSDNNDALSVTLAAASPETRALLAHTLPVLEETLSQQNVATNAYILDLNEIEAEEKAEKAVASSAAAVHTLSDPKRVGSTELAAADTSAAAASSEQQRVSSNLRWMQGHSVTDGQGRLRGV